jgi:outer membrane protein TolC
MIKNHGFVSPLAMGLVYAVGLVCAAPAMSAQNASVQQSAGTSAPVAMALPDVVNRLRAQNRAILSKAAEARIAATGITRAESAFQPQLSLGVVRGTSSQKNTYEEDLIRERLGVYQREGTDFSAGISSLVSATGAKLELKSALSRFITNNNLRVPNRPPGAYDNRTNAGFSLTQPLARDAGADVTLAKLNMARLDSTVATLASRDTETSVVAEALLAYHELVLAQHRVEAAQEKISTSTQLLEEARALQRNGRLPQSDVWEVENALARYQSALSEAVHGQLERANRLRTMLMLEATASASGFRALDALPQVDARPLDASQLLQSALQRRDDYQLRKVQMEREGIQLSYAKNQQLPRVDLVASYGLGALEYSARQAIDINRARDYPSWSLGLQVNVPLGMNKLAQADLQAALLRRDDAALALRAIEVQIANDIDTSLALRASVIERWQLWQQVAQREAQQLTAERSRFAAGRSDTRELLLRLERVINARLAVREQQAGYAKADTLLQAAQGSLMERFP